MNSDKQLAHNQHPRLNKALLGLLATTALYACTPTGERAELTDQTIPVESTTEFGPQPESTTEIDSTQELKEYMRDDERTSNLNGWVGFFAGKLGTASVENPSVFSTTSSTDSEGNSSFSYNVVGLNDIITFTLSGEEAPDNKLGLIPNSIGVDVSSSIDGGSYEAGNGYKVYITFNSETESYDTGYTMKRMSSNGSEITELYSTSIGEVKKITRQPGDFGPAGESGQSSKEASRIDAETISTIIELIDKSVGVSSGLQEATSPGNGEEVIENKGGPDKGP